MAKRSGWVEEEEKPLPKITVVMLGFHHQNAASLSTSTMSHLSGMFGDAATVIAGQ